MKTRILIVDDHRLFLEGIKALLDLEANFNVVQACRDVQDAMRFLEKNEVDVVIMDVTMPNLNGIDGTRMLLETFPAIRVIAVSMHSDIRFITEMLSSGALGYVAKESASDELVSAIQSVMRGEPYMCRVANKAVLRNMMTRGKKTEAEPATLSNRERRVLQLYAEGKSTRQIGDALCLSTKTVDSYRAQLMRKLDLHSIADLTKYAVREGLTSLEG